MIKTTQIIVKCKDEDVCINCLKLSYLGKVMGLMFSSLKNSDILLLEFDKDVRKSIHSLYVFFDFFAVWLDEDNNVIEYHIVKPWTKELMPTKKYRKLIEIPMNNKNQELIRKICTT